MRGCYDAQSYYYGTMTVELEVAIDELERIGRLRRYMREALLDLVDDLEILKNTLIYQLRWGDGTDAMDGTDALELRRGVRTMELLCSKLENLLMRRRRMREPLIKVAYRLDHVKNKLKWNLTLLCPVKE